MRRRLTREDLPLLPLWQELLMRDLHAASRISKLIVQPLLQLLQLSRMLLLELGCSVSPELACNRQRLLMSPSLLSQQGLLFTYALSILVSHLLGSSRELLSASIQLLLILSHPSKVVCRLGFPLLPADLLLLPDASSGLYFRQQLVTLVSQVGLLFPSLLSFPLLRRLKGPKEKKNVRKRKMCIRTFRQQAGDRVRK